MDELEDAYRKASSRDEKLRIMFRQEAKQDRIGLLRFNLTVPIPDGRNDDRRG